MDSDNNTKLLSSRHLEIMENYGGSFGPFDYRIQKR